MTGSPGRGVAVTVSGRPSIELKKRVDAARRARARAARARRHRATTPLQSAHGRSTFTLWCSSFLQIAATTRAFHVMRRPLASSSDAMVQRRASLLDQLRVELREVLLFVATVLLQFAIGETSRVEVFAWRRRSNADLGEQRFRTARRRRRSQRSLRRRAPGGASGRARCRDR